MNTISLLNGEVLSLNWSSNVGNRLDVEYDIQFYQKNGKDKEDSLLFSMAVAPAQLRSAGWDTDSSKARNMVPVELKDAEGKSAGTWYFPITFLEEELEELSIDASIIQAHQHSAGAKKGGLQMKSGIAVEKPAPKSMRQ